ncbi:MAG TPA: BrnT family toxin [Thermoanaerobaculia bacterium]|nr:BrnT family toxin [Thermoanaerobaculia bacterium]
MRIEGIIWIEDIVDKLWRKHRVAEVEVEEVLQNRPRFRFVEKGHRAGEDVYAALGRTDAGRLLIVFFIYKEDAHALIVSAREMTSTERERYERK